MSKEPAEQAAAKIGRPTNCETSLEHLGAIYEKYARHHQGHPVPDNVPPSLAKISMKQLKKTKRPIVLTVKGESASQSYQDAEPISACSILPP